MYIADYKGVLFAEGTIPEASVIRPISTEINGIFTQSQLKSLNDIKDGMVNEVKRAGGNCVMNFVYGQRSTFLKSIFGLDDVYWHASGVIVRLNEQEIARLTPANR